MWTLMFQTFIILSGVLYKDFHHWEKPYHHMWKVNYNNLSRVRDSQSAAGISLALFSAINERQSVPFLKHELMWLLAIKIIKKRIYGCSYVDMEYLAKYSTQYLVEHSWFNTAHHVLGLDLGI